jgi:3-isopropylmalate/(R)-2-methylmalate dehydratase small subunit
MILEGTAHVFGNHVNTDYIISAKHKSRLTDLDEMAKLIMDDIRPGFYKEIHPGDFLVGGINFGCGSSRETAPWVIQEGDRLKVDLDKGNVENLTRGGVLGTHPLPPFIQKILDAGGMENFFKTYRSFDL